MVLGDDCEDNHVWNMIYSFHMPAFMTISGYFSFREYGGGYFHFVVRRFCQLMVPYFVWSLFSWIVGLRNLQALQFIIVDPDKYFWFLWVLFWISCIFILAQWLSDKLKIDVLLPGGLFCIFLIGIMVLFDIRDFGFQFISYYFIFYMLGYCIHRFPLILVSNKFVLILLVITWLIFAWWWNMHTLPIWFTFNSILPATLLQYIYRGFTAVVGIVVLMSLSPKCLNDTNKINCFLKEYGAISLGIYVVHIIIMYRIVMLVNYLFPAVPDLFLILIVFVLNSLSSLLIVKMLLKNKWIARLAFGKF